MFKRWMTPFVVAAATLSAPGAGAAESVSAGIVKRLAEPVTLERGGVQQPVTAGMQVQAGDRIVTGARGAVGIVLADDSQLTAGPDSRFVVYDVRFDTTTHDGNIVVRLLRGALHVVTGLIARQAPQNVRIETPTAVMGVRGTEFIVETRAQAE